MFTESNESLSGRGWLDAIHVFLRCASSIKHSVFPGHESKKDHFNAGLVY